MSIYTSFEKNTHQIFRMLELFRSILLSCTICRTERIEVTEDQRAHIRHHRKTGPEFPLETNFRLGDHVWVYLDPYTLLLKKRARRSFNPLTSKSGYHLLSPYNITTESPMKAVRIKEITTN